MGWTISKTFRFEASHQLPLHDGRCARLHGHSWRMKVFVAASELHRSGPQTGMVMDYGHIKAIVQPFVDEYLDHHHLNDTTPLENPTCEELARWIYIHLFTDLPGLVAVEVKETCTSGCLFENKWRTNGADAIRSS